MKTSLISVLLILTTFSFGQKFDKFEPFISSDYPKEKFQVTIDTFEFFGMSIESRMVRDNSNQGAFDCRAWLSITKKGVIKYQRYFKSIIAVGSCFGLFAPITQPRHDYFLIQKSGDYNSIIFIVDSIGNITEKFGSGLSVSKDKRYLFSHSSAEGILTVFDFSYGRCLFSDTINTNLGAWYSQDNKYISPISHYKPELFPETYAIFDLTINKLIISKKNDIIPDPINRLPNYLDRDNIIDCNCGRERNIQIR